MRGFLFFAARLWKGVVFSGGITEQRFEEDYGTEEEEN